MCFMGALAKSLNSIKLPFKLSLLGAISVSKSPKSRIGKRKLVSCTAETPYESKLYQHTARAICQSGIWRMAPASQSIRLNNLSAKGYERLFRPDFYVPGP